MRTPIRRDAIATVFQRDPIEAAISDDRMEGRLDQQWGEETAKAAISERVPRCCSGQSGLFVRALPRATALPSPRPLQDPHWQLDDTAAKSAEEPSRKRASKMRVQIKTMRLIRGLASKIKARFRSESLGNRCGACALRSHEAGSPTQLETVNFPARSLDVVLRIPLSPLKPRKPLHWPDGFFGSAKARERRQYPQQCCPCLTPRARVGA
jgi:hypothetical protein